MSKHKKNVGSIVHSHGVTFRVWAPFAQELSVNYGTSMNWQSAPLESEGDGYWSALVRGAEAGQEYQYVIKNGDQILNKNDPRALQLTSNNGTSLVVDTEFDWENDEFQMAPRAKQIVYEMHIGTFNKPDDSSEGTFYNAIERLDHLASLGINVIELMPIGSMIHDHGWGYNPDFIYAVESTYGGRHALLEFVKTAHSKGIGVILDVVYNHFGPDDETQLWRFDGWYENEGGGIYFYNDWRGQTPWGPRPDYGRIEVRNFLLDNVKYWLNDCHLDGLRVDSTLYTKNVYGRYNDTSTDLPEAWTFLQDLNTIARKIRPDALMVGEDVADNDYITKPVDQSGAGFDAQWQVTMPHSFRTSLCANDQSGIDLASLITELTKTYNGDALQRVVYIDSHDSAANGAARLVQQIDPKNPHSTKALSKSLIAAGILLSVPGIPMLLQGQEFAQCGSFDDWRKLDWNLTEQLGGYVLAYKHLIDLRKNSHNNTAGLSGQSTNVCHVDENNKVIAYHRWDQGGPRDDVVVIANFTKKHHEEYRLGWPKNGKWVVRFNSTWSGYHPSFKNIEVAEATVNSGMGSIILPPNSILILSQDS